MQYIKVNSDIWIEYDGTNGATRVISKKETERLIAQEADWISKNSDLSSAELSAWELDNHPYQKEIKTHKDTKKYLDDLVKQLK